MKTILAVLAIAALCLSVQAQSNQAFQQKTYYASDYGTWQIKGQSANNYQFSPSSVCEVSPPNTSQGFQPFNTNAPVMILDALPANTEIVTPTSIVDNASYCGIIAQPIHVHYSFSLLSATDGLQEVLNQISSSIPYAAQVILDRNWYEALRGIPGASAPAIIAAAKGSTAAYLVDQTQAPYAFYTWNGLAYVQVAPFGGAAAGALTGNFPAPQLVSQYVPTFTTNQSTGAADSRATIQAAITAAIAANQELYIPGGTYIVSCPTPNSSTPALTAPTSNFRMRGAGSQASVSSPLTTSITATGACPILNIGTGSVTSAQPGGYFTGIELEGNGKPAVGSPTGYYDLSVNGIPGFEVFNNYFGHNDIGLEFEGNSFGAVAVNNWVTFGSTNAAIYVPVGSSSGSDLTFDYNWVNGAFCGYCVTASGGIHIKHGQTGAGQGTTGTNDNCGAVVLNYDYPTGSITGTTQTDIDSTSFEGTQGCWMIRNYGQTNLTVAKSVFQAFGPFFEPPVAPAIGVYKGTTMQFAQTAFRDNEITGFYSNQQLIVADGSYASNTGFLFAESNTQIAAQAPTINGVLAFAAMADASGNRWTTMLGQSGLQANADINDESGPLIGGFRPLTTPSLLSIGSIPYGTGQPPNVASALAGNNSATDQVYVSHGVTIAPEVKSCSAQQSGSSSAVTCPVSAPPAVNETEVCAVSAYTNPNDLIAVDENNNLYNDVGNFTTFSDTTGWMQFAYHTYTAAPSPTISVINGYPNNPVNNLAIQCQTVVGTTFTNPLDGQCVANVTSGNLTCSTAITTTQANDYIMCGGFNGTGSSSLSAGSGFTAGQAIGGNYLAQYQLKASAGSITPTMSWSGTGGAGMVCVALKMASVVAPGLENAPAISAANMFAGGTTFTATGCGTPTSLTGGALAGSFLAQSGTCTAVVTTGVTAPNGYACSVWDVTTTADAFKQTAYNATTVTFAGSPTSGDKIVFQCAAF